MIFIDTETTGLLKPSAILEEQPKIIEICLIKTDENYNQLDIFDTLVNPEIEIEPIITRITGIDYSMVRDKPTYAQIHDKVVDFFLGERIVVAHNAPFDMGIIWAAVARMGLEYHFPWCPIWHCTAEESKKINGKRLKLTQLHELATGEPHDEGAHRATADVEALIRCHKWLVEKGYFSIGAGVK